MASISSAGVGSGLDVSSIISQLMSVEKAPLQQMQTEATKIQSKLSAYGKVQSYVSALRDASLKLTNANTWGDTTATSGDASIFTASTTSSATAANYSLTVKQLASAQTVASAAWPASVTTVGAGVLRLDVGKWESDTAAVNPGQFTQKSGTSSVDVTVLATDTLSDVRDKINAAKAGVMASIVNDANGSRLVLRSSETGEENGFRIQATDDDGQNNDVEGLSRLAFDPPNAVIPTDPVALQNAVFMSKTLSAANSVAEVDGLSVSSANNLLTGVIEGVTIKLGKVSTTPVSLAVASNSEAIKTSVSGFVEAYNNLNKYLVDQTKYDAAAKQGALLQGDSGTNALRSAMRNIASSSGGMTGAFKRLADIGIDTKTDGTLSVDSTKLGKALDKLADIKELFATRSMATDAENGFAARFQQWGDALLRSDGALTTRSESLQRQITANTKKQDGFSTRMTLVEARMRAQYTALDTQMAKLNGLSSYMTQQITNMNNSSS